MSGALTGMSDDDALQLLTGLGDLEKSGRVNRAAIAEVITEIGNMGFQIDRPRDDAESGGGEFTFDQMLAAIKAQKFSAPR